MRIEQLEAKEQPEAIEQPEAKEQPEAIEQFGAYAHIVMLVAPEYDGVAHLVIWSFCNNALFERVYAKLNPPLWPAEFRASQLPSYSSSRLRKIATALMAASAHAAQLSNTYAQVASTSTDPITGVGVSKRYEPLGTGWEAEMKAREDAETIVKSLAQDSSISRETAAELVPDIAMFHGLTRPLDTRKLVRAFLKFRASESPSVLPRHRSPNPTEFGSVSFDTAITHTLGMATGAVCLGNDLKRDYYGTQITVVRDLENIALKISEMYNAETMKAIRDQMELIQGDPLVRGETSLALNPEDNDTFETFNFMLRRLVHTVDNYVLQALSAKPITMDDMHPATGTSDTAGLLPRPGGTTAPGKHPSPDQVHIDTDDDHVWLISIPLTAGSETAVYDTTNFDKGTAFDKIKSWLSGNTKPPAPSMHSPVKRTSEMREHKCGGPTIFKGNFPHSTPKHAQTHEQSPSGERVEIEVYDNIMWLRGFRTHDALTPEQAVEKLQAFSA